VEEILLVPKATLVENPLRRILQREEDVVDMNHNPRRELGEHLEVQVVHIAAGLRDMRGVNKKDVASPELIEEPWPDILDPTLDEPGDPGYPLAEKVPRVGLDADDLGPPTQIHDVDVGTEQGGEATTDLDHPPRPQAAENAEQHPRVEPGEQAVVIEEGTLGSSRCRVSGIPEVIREDPHVLQELPLPGEIQVDSGRSRVTAPDPLLAPLQLFEIRDRRVEMAVREPSHLLSFRVDIIELRGYRDPTRGASADRRPAGSDDTCPQRQIAVAFGGPALRILIATAHIPFQRRRTETLAEDLSAALRLRGDETEVVRVPFSWTSAETFLDHSIAARLMDWTGTEAMQGDLLIALEFPTYLIPHPRKILWLTHDVPDPQEAGALDLEVAQVRRALETVPLSGAVRRFAISATAAADFKARTGFDATVLYPPAPDALNCVWKRPEDYVLVPPGVGPRRVEMILEALTEAESPLRVKHCGSYSESVDFALRDCALRLKVADRVDWLGELADDALSELYAESHAVLYPARHDTFPNVALAAGQASKALVVCSDSGAPAELIGDGDTGLVLPAQPSRIARALDDLWTQPDRTAVLGERASAAIRSPDYEWNHVLDLLLRLDRERVTTEAIA